MLVLSRQKDQTIMIGDLVEITVVDIRGDKVRLGITAPLEVPVHRKEIYEAIQNENRAASRADVDDVSLLDRIIRQPGQPAPDSGTADVRNSVPAKNGAADRPVDSTNGAGARNHH